MKCAYPGCEIIPSKISGVQKVYCGVEHARLGSKINMNMILKKKARREK